MWLKSMYDFEVLSYGLSEMLKWWLDDDLTKMLPMRWLQTEESWSPVKVFGNLVKAGSGSQSKPTEIEPGDNRPLVIFQLSSESKIGTNFYGMYTAVPPTVSEVSNCAWTWTVIIKSLIPNHLSVIWSPNHSHSYSFSKCTKEKNLLLHSIIRWF